ncbi:hypothetical protein CP980_00260 [Streptomyces vinaceus]|uniref:ATP-binding protein n=1 Tax=Streptomyces vinaceus TaxID=1960 RepID=A0A5J6J7Z0_STRVI|nr:hypothetical protein CP980_00260 [Streptomyces vinaceus]
MRPRPGGLLRRITAGADTVTVEVRDRSTAPPLLKPWARGEPSGFGWPLVNQLASTDVRTHHDGKTVTATLTTAPTGRP